MEIIPAVDLRGGRCVRLYQGDYSQETVFSDDPVSIALRWQSMGASRLHVVDLDGAAQGEPQNLEVVKKIVNEVSIPIQLGGGIRDRLMVERVFQIGVDRVILGTGAVEYPELVEEACHIAKEKIIVGVDVREGYVATHGWRRGADISATDFIYRMMALGVERFIYTDVTRDGTLTEPNFDAIGELVKFAEYKMIAAGGISSISHLQRLNSLNVEGAIVGRAIYTGDIDLKAALIALK